MKFEIAVAVVLAQEALSSSVVAPQGAPTLPGSVMDIQARARLRKESSEAISNGSRRQEYRPSKRIRRQRNGRILRNQGEIYEGRLQQLSLRLSGAANQQQGATSPVDTGSNGGFPDFGILPSTPMNGQRNNPEDRIHRLSSITHPQFRNEGTSRNNDLGPRSNSVVPDFGTLPSTLTEENPKIPQDGARKVLDLMKTQRQTGSSSGDLGSHRILQGITESYDDDDSFFGDDDSFFNDVDDVIKNSTAVLCDSVSPYCETCQVTDLEDPETGDLTGEYNIEMNCTGLSTYFNVLTDSFAMLCEYNLCQSTCSVDKENFLVDMKNCSSRNMFDVVGIVAAKFDYHYANVCEASEEGTDELPCRSCGRKLDTESSSFSFEIDCPSKLSPSKLSASGSGFGSYFIRAKSFCDCPSRYSVQCSTCEVNIWMATINIDECIPFSDYDLQLLELGNCDSYSPFEMEYFAFDESIPAYTYQQYCNPYNSFLEDSIGLPDCDCTFDEPTQTASFRCSYEPVCQDVPSYCQGNPLEFCDSYLISMSIPKNGKISRQRCINVSSPYEFSYCVGYDFNEDGHAATDVISPINTTGACVMEVDGIRCNSCSIVRTEVSEDVLYNCNNTVIGTNGPGNLSTNTLLDDTMSYFIYKSLPCTGGCDLCGIGSDGLKNEFMTNPDGRFASEFWKNGMEERCFDAQLAAMAPIQALNSEECQAIADSARQPCGCKNPNTPPNPSPPASEARSSGSKITTAGVMLLTIAAASIVQMLLG